MSTPVLRRPGPAGKHDHHEAPSRGQYGAHRTPHVTKVTHRPAALSAFPNIPNLFFDADVKEREDEPWRINQAGSSLCGAASVMYLLAKHRPSAYAHYVRQLYWHGMGWLGALKVKPSKSCRRFKPAGKIAGVDWVALASLRDSENAIFDYDDTSDEAAGITFPHEVAKWLGKAGFKQVDPQVNVYLTKGEDNLKKALELKSKGHEVCLLIDANLLNKHKHRGALAQVFTCANHWIVLNPRPGQKIEVTKERVQFTVFTWGQEYREISPDPKNPVTLEVFLQNYYGYIASVP